MDFSKATNKDFALKLHEWHGGQDTGMYSLASCLLAHATNRHTEGGQFMPQPCSVEAALQELGEIHGHEDQAECEALLAEIKRRYATLPELDDFTLAYIECALWSSTDDASVPLNDHHTLADLAPETLARIKEDCAKFQAENQADIATGCVRTHREGCTPSDPAQAGHDFWFTRCGHGSGFWDGDWEEEPGERMTESSKRFGEISLYEGDDKKLYFM